MSRPARIATLLMALSLVLSAEGLLVIQGVFLLRQDYVAAHLCVNRAVPDSPCHGRCFVKKQAERRQERQDQQPPDLALVLLAPALAGTGRQVPPPPPHKHAPGVAKAYSGVFSPGFPAEVFVPPRTS